VSALDELALRRRGRDVHTGVSPLLPVEFTLDCDGEGCGTVARFTSITQVKGWLVMVEPGPTPEQVFVYCPPCRRRRGL
jgi:hypothetical protein